MKRVQVISTIPRRGANGEIRLGGWIEGPDGTLFRLSSIPAGMTIQETERIVSQPGWKPTARTQNPSAYICRSSRNGKQIAGWNPRQFERFKIW